MSTAQLYPSSIVVLEGLTEQLCPRGFNVKLLAGVRSTLSDFNLTTCAVIMLQT